MANKQRLLTAVALHGIVLLVTHVASKCPDDQICDCTEDYIKCNCSHREEVIFKDTTEGDEGFMGEEIVVNGCGSVKIMKLSLSDSDLRSLYLSDLLQLQIESFSLYSAKVVNLHISKIKNFTLESQGFGDMQHIGSLTISDVTIGELEPSIFSKSEARHLVIKNSQIGTIKPRSLEPLNCDDVRIENSAIHNIAASAINVGGTIKFSFLNNHVNVTEINSFTLPSGKEVDFGFCRFSQISSNMISAKQVESFYFHDNTVISCEEKAFWGVQVTKEARFVRNYIMHAKVDSIIPNNGPNDPGLTISESVNNTFGCNCTIEWLLKSNLPKYDLFKQRNSCFYPQRLSGLRLSELKVQKGTDGNCSFVSDLTAEDESPDIRTTTKIEPIGLTSTETGALTVATASEKLATKHPRVPIARTSNEQRRPHCKGKTEPSNSSVRREISNIVFILITLLISTL